MKIGMLSQWFDPEPGPAAIPGVLSREFVRAGHDVKVLTGFPNYPDGKTYEGYRQRIRDTRIVSGVGVTRVPLYPSHSGSALGRILNYGSFSASATVLGAGSLRGVEAVWVYNSPVTVSLPLLVGTAISRVPYFLHVQDLWPDSLLESGMFASGRTGRIAAAAIQKVVEVTENRAGVIGVISPSVRELILSRNRNLDPAKIVYVPNPTDETLFRPRARETGWERPEGSPFALMYVGAIGEVQGLSTLLDAAEILRGRNDIVFHLVGDGIARVALEKSAKERGLRNVVFRDRIPKEQVPDMMATADAQLVSLADSEFLRHTMPSKIASLLASEVPVIGQIAGDSERVLRESGAAMTVAPGDADGLAAATIAMSELSEDARRSMAASGRAFYEKNFSAAIAASTIVKALKGTTGNE